MTNFRNTFYVFFWKVKKQKRFHWFKNALFTLLPIILVIINFVILHEDESRLRHTAISEPINEDDLEAYLPASDTDMIYFAPQNAFTKRLMETMRKDLNIIEERVEGVDSEEDLRPFMEEKDRFFAVLFNIDNHYSDVTPPLNFSYTIRTKNNNFHTHQIYNGDVFDANNRGEDEYIRSGFLTLQHWLDKTYMKMVSGNRDFFKDISVQVKRFPIPHDSPISEEGVSTFCYTILSTYVFYSILLIIIPMVEEKEGGFKEHVKNATRYSYLNNFCFYLVNYGQLVTTFLVCLILSMGSGTWSCFNIGIVFLFGILFIFALMCFAIFLVTFFDSVLFANFGSLLLFLIQTLVFFMIPTSFMRKIQIGLPLNAFLLGTEILSKFKAADHCFTISSITHKGYPGIDEYSLGEILLAFLAEGFVFLFLHFYISNVCPGKHGTPRSIFFLFQPSYYTPNKIDCADVGSVVNTHGKVYERSDGAEAIVKVRNLTKTFRSLSGRKKTAVHDVSFDIYKNQITAVLGHNGAGKTTAMCMLTGMVSKTSGIVSVDGVQDINYFRTAIGFCPQHNIFLPYLTCREHLLFFGQLRGLTLFQANQEASLILNKINLNTKSSSVAKNLSGGMMRKLCLGNAIIGKTKLLVLDEPSSGLDPESRRDIWNVLCKLKKDHTILISTHFMEEADVLGDRIAILEEGKLIAFGTSMFLKQHYGTGYTIKMLKEPSFKKADVVDAITKEIPKAEFKQMVEPTFCATLPYKDQDKYVSILENLENKKQEYGIEALSITNTTLEEVFLNSATTDKILQKTSDETDSSYVLIEGEARRSNYCGVSFKHFRAVLYKKSIYLKRKMTYFFLMMLIPCCFAMIPFIIFNKSPESESKYFSMFNLSALSIPNPIIVLCVSNEHLSVSKKIEAFLEQELAETEGGEISYGGQINCDEHLLNLANTDRIKFYDRVVGALDVTVEDTTYEMTMTAMYSMNVLHSSAIALNLGNKMLAKLNINDSINIITANAPLVKSSIDFKLPFYYTMLVPLGMMMYMAFYLPLPLNERIIEVRKLQNISPFLYWVSFFIIDALLHTFVCGMLILVTFAWDHSSVFSANDYKYLFLLYLFYGYAYLTLIYTVSQLFQSLSSATSVLMFLLIIGMVGCEFLSTGVAKMQEYSQYITFMHIFPDFALKHSMKVIYEISKFEQTYQQPEIGQIYKKQFIKAVNDLNLTKFFMFIPIYGLILFACLIVLLEDIYIRHRLLKYYLQFMDFICCRKYIRDEYKQPDDEMDKYVLDEKKYVEDVIKSNTVDEYPIVVSQLEKNYMHLKAVRGIDFAVRKGECFGLLGMNGAGKSSTFKMMTLNETISKGQVFIHGQSCYVNEFQYKSQFGYCPQNDALNLFMTSYETLRYYAMLRCVQPHRIHEEVMMWLRKVDIEKYKNTQVQFYSGGTKRKLNTAIAMIGSPRVIFLDEPTTGVDPKSRRFVWGCIKKFQNSENHSIILTSHSMDECETLCNRLAIMVKGNFKCVGPIQKLKSQYGVGFSLIIKLRNNVITRLKAEAAAAAEEEAKERDQVDGNTLKVPNSEGQAGTANDGTKFTRKSSTVLMDLKLKVSQLFRCELKDEHEGMLQYFIYDDDISWADVFTKLTKFNNENKLVVENFSINETTLEDIFLQFREPVDKDNVETTEL